MKNFISKYDFDNFDDNYKFKLSFRNGAKFKLLDVDYIYYFIPKEKEQILISNYYCDNLDFAKAKIDIANKLFSYIFGVPVYTSYVHEDNSHSSNTTNFQSIKIAKPKLDKLAYISNKVSKFNKEKNLFNDVMTLYSIALKNLVVYRSL